LQWSHPVRARLRAQNRAARSAFEDHAGQRICRKGGTVATTEQVQPLPAIGHRLPHPGICGFGGWGGVIGVISSVDLSKEVIDEQAQRT